MMAQNISVGLEVKVKEAIQDVKKFASAATAQLETVSKAVSGISLASANFAANLASSAVIGSFNALQGAATSLFKTFVVEGVQAAQVQEDALNSLSQALANTGEFSQDALQDLQDFAASIQATTTVGDEAVLQQLALAKAFGATNEQAKVIVEAAIDLAAATGKGLNEAVSQVSKTLGGFAGELGEVNPQIKALTQEQLRAGEAAKILLEQYGGAGAAQVRTFSGALAQAKNAFGDLQEEIGFTITKSAGAVEVINLFSKQFVSIGTVFAENRKQIREFTVNALASLIGGFGKVVEAISFVPVAFVELQTLLPAVAADILKLINVIKEFDISLTQALNFNGIFDGYIAEQKRALQASKELQEAFAEGIKEERAAASETSNSLKSFATSIFEFQSKVAASAKNTADAVIEQEQRKTDAVKKGIEEQALFFLDLEAKRFTDADKQIQQEIANIEAINGVRSSGQIEDLERTIQYLDTLAIVHQENADLLLSIRRRRIEAEQKLEETKSKALEQNARSTLSTIATLQNSSNKSLAAAGKAAAATQLAISAVVGIGRALELPYPINIPAAALVGAAYAEQFSKLNAVRLQTGLTEVPQGFPNDTFPAQLSSGERVVSANQNQDLKEFLNNPDSGSSAETGEKLDSGFGNVSGILQQISAKLSNLENQIVVNIGNKEVIREIRSGLRQGRSLEV